MLAALGRWCFRRRWWVLVAWILAVGAGGLAAGPVFGGLANDPAPPGVESTEAYEQINAGNDADGEVAALIDGVDPGAEATRRIVTATAQALAQRGDVLQVAHPFTGRPGAAAMIGRNGSSAVVSVTLRAGSKEAEEATLDAVQGRLRALAGELRAAGQGSARVRLGGNKLLNRQVNEGIRKDLERAELISLPLTLVVLVVVFGGLLAAGLPVLAAVVSAAASMLVLLVFSAFTDLDQNTVTVVTLLGLGLSIDYGLLLVARYREEAAGGGDPVEALARAWATAGRTVLFSALTVAAALAGLLMFDLRDLRALGAAGVSIAVVAMAAALTFTAALIGFGHRRLARPGWFTRRRKVAAAAAGVDAAADGEAGFFARLSRFVQRRPWPVALLVTAGLLAAGAPLLSVTMILPRLEALPASIESVQVAKEMRADFALRSAPAVLVVARTDPDSLDVWAARWNLDPAVAGVRAAKADGPGLSQVELALKGGSQDAAARRLVERVRADRPPGGRSWVAGDAALLTDLLGIVRDGLPLAVTTTVLAMVVLLFAMTGSLVVPVKAILANVVSLGATFGVLVAVFEHGHGAGLLNTLTVGGLSPFIVVIVFAFAFGLSMDYEVFLLGRIKEYVDRGIDSDTAVRRGLQHTGRIITSAALLMIVVFSCFAFAEMGQIEEVGVGLTMAVLIDATVVRCLLVPATMTLLGRWNWWAPAPLKRLHERWGLRESVPVDEADRELVPS